MDTLMLNGVSIADLVVHDADIAAVYDDDNAVDAREGFIAAPSKCYLCDHGFIEGEEPWRMFDKRMREDGQPECSLSDILGSALGCEILEEQPHSTLLCDACNATVLEFENLEQRFCEMRLHILSIYNRTAKANDLEAIGIELNGQLQDVDDVFEIVIDGQLEKTPQSGKTVPNQMPRTEDNLAVKDTIQTNSGTFSNADYSKMYETILDESSIVDIGTDGTSHSDLVASDGLIGIKHEEPIHQEFIMCTNELGIEGEDIIIYNDIIQGSSQLSPNGTEELSQTGSVFTVRHLNPHEDELEPKREEPSMFKRRGDDFLCLMCLNAQWFDQKQFTEHMRAEHKTRISPCSVCSDVFFTRQELKQHVEKLHGGEPRFQCDVCQRTFANTHQLHVHKRLHNTNVKHFECDLCQKRYSSKTLLAEHMNRHTGDRPYKCEQCAKEFSSKYTLRMHMKIHTERQRPFKCDVCDKAFLKHQTLLQHRKLHVGEKNFVCDVCSKAFGTKHNLDVHKVLHTGQRPFVCETCGKSFTRRGDIRDHERTHTGERPFRCDLCPLAFAQRSNLMSHKKSTHMNERLHTCPDCGRSFKRRRLLDYHVRSAHTGERPYKCDVCGAGFVYPDHMKKHMNLHTGRKPYSCEVCGKLFNSRENRNAHRFVHSDKKPYECIDCGASFMRKPLLLSHIKQMNHSNDTIIVNQPQINSLQVASEDSNIEFVGSPEALGSEDAGESLDNIIESDETLLGDMKIEQAVEEETAVGEEDIMKEDIEEMQYMQFDTGLDDTDHGNFTWVDIDSVKE